MYDAFDTILVRIFWFLCFFLLLFVPPCRGTWQDRRQTPCGLLSTSRVRSCAEIPSFIKFVALVFIARASKHERASKNFRFFKTTSPMKSPQSWNRIQQLKQTLQDISANIRRPRLTAAPVHPSSSVPPSQHLSTPPSLRPSLSRSLNRSIFLSCHPPFFPPPIRAFLRPPTSSSSSSRQ